MFCFIFLNFLNLCVIPSRGTVNIFYLRASVCPASMEDAVDYGIGSGYVVGKVWLLAWLQTKASDQTDWYSPAWFLSNTLEAAGQFPT